MAAATEVRRIRNYDTTQDHFERSGIHLLDDAWYWGALLDATDDDTLGWKSEYDDYDEAEAYAQLRGWRR